MSIVYSTVQYSTVQYSTDKSLRLRLIFSMFSTTNIHITASGFVVVDVVES